MIWFLLFAFWTVCGIIGDPLGFWIAGFAALIALLDTGWARPIEEEQRGARQDAER